MLTMMSSRAQRIMDMLKEKKEENVLESDDAASSG